MNKQMFNQLFRLVVCAVALVSWPYALQAEIRLPPFFSNGMVLQRDGAAPLWGTASPGEAITAQLNGQTVLATADGKGNWSTAFKGLAAGGPFTLTLKGGSDAITISNVLVGDVWLCAGEMNMASTLGDMGALAKDDLAAATDPQLRWFGSKNMMFGDAFQGRTWTDTTPATTSTDSAVAYYFARELRRKINIPVGIIVVTSQFSPLQTWLSPEGFDSIGLGPEARTALDEFNNLDTATPRFLRDLAAWEKTCNRQDPGNKGFALGWADPKTDTSDWKTIPNLGDWSSLDIPDGGVLWIRKSVDMPAETAGKDISLSIGLLSNEPSEFGNVLGTVYFNNREVGTLGDCLKRVYVPREQPPSKVPGNLVVPGANVIAIRLFTQVQKPHWKKTDLKFNAADKTAWPSVTPDWLAKVEAKLPPQPPDAVAGRPVTPNSPFQSGLPSIYYNLLLKPIAGYGIKGVVWYQGEADNETFLGDMPTILKSWPPFFYRKLLPAFIADLRRHWHQPDLPFCFAQLPAMKAHIHPNGQPQKSDLAQCRESQLLTWQTVPNTGMIISIDLGNGILIPPNKKPFGERLALAALAKAYGQKVDFSGPIYDSMAVEGKKISVKFKSIGSGLVAQNGPLGDFAIAGADQKFIWADAVIDGDTVVVSSPSVPAPIAVRYGWLDTPLNCNLYNKEGLPASPFRTDTWPMP
jgi:sialate O-acetylesterase